MDISIGTIDFDKLLEYLKMRYIKSTNEIININEFLNWLASYMATFHGIIASNRDISHTEQWVKDRKHPINTLKPGKLSFLDDLALCLRESGVFAVHNGNIVIKFKE